MNIVIHILNSDGIEQPLYLSSYDFFDTDIFTEAALQKISKIIFWFFKRKSIEIRNRKLRIDVKGYKMLLNWNGCQICNFYYQYADTNFNLH